MILSVGDFGRDQIVGSINAIREQRPCAITFHDGARTQRVMDAAVKSAGCGQWVEL